MSGSILLIVDGSSSITSFKNCSIKNYFKFNDFLLKNKFKDFFIMCVSICEFYFFRIFFQTFCYFSYFDDCELIKNLMSFLEKTVLAPNYCKFSNCFKNSS